MVVGDVADPVGFRVEFLAGLDIAAAALNHKFAENLAAFARLAQRFEDVCFKKTIGGLLLKLAFQLIEMALQIVNTEISSAFGKVGLVVTGTGNAGVSEVVRLVDHNHILGMMLHDPEYVGRYIFSFFPVPVIPLLQIAMDFPV